MRPATFSCLLTALLAGCGGNLMEQISTARTLEEYRGMDPKDYLEPVGDFVEGRFTMVYVAVEVSGPDGQRLHPEVPRADRAALMRADRDFIFGDRASPLAGTAERVNMLLTKEPLVVKLDAARLAKLKAGATASEVVDVWAAHAFLEGLLHAHPKFFGHDPQAVFQIPLQIRDQATWFRFDRARNVIETSMATWSTKDWRKFAALLEQETLRQGDPAGALVRVLEGILRMGDVAELVDALFPKLKLPLVWHGVGDKKGLLRLKPAKKSHPAPPSSIVLFHELGHIGECRAADEYAEEGLKKAMQADPRQAAAAKLLGGTLGPKALVGAVKKNVGGLPIVGETIVAKVAEWAKLLPDEGVNVSKLLLHNDVARRAFGKVMGEPNVLPLDPEAIERTWGKLPGFKQNLWKEGRPLKEGAVRVVKGGLYLPDHAFARLQVYERGEWRNTYMGDSLTHDAPIGPVMEACLGRLAERIRRD